MMKILDPKSLQDAKTIIDGATNALPSTGILDKIGLMPLPPYIHEELKEKDRYQTVYAKYQGSAAAPTELPGLQEMPTVWQPIS